MGAVVPFIEGKLLLRVNRGKSQVAPISKVKFLGYSFYKTKGEGRLRIHPQSVSRMKAKLKELTSRSNGWGNDRRKEAFRQYIAGWVNYYKLANLVKLGVKKPKAWEWANTRKGYWHIANSFILTTTITTGRLRQSGYVFLSDYYQKVSVKT